MRPSLPTRLAARTAGALFGALARARHDRALHPKGTLRTAVAALDGTVVGVPALARAREARALLRESRAIGLPGAAPDILGVAVRFCDLHGEGRHQDLLFASSPPPPGHLVLAPAMSRSHEWYTGLLPYRVGDRRAVLAARCVGEHEYELGITGVGRRFTRFATVRGGEPAAPGDQAVRFDVLEHCAPELRQDAGPLDAVRRRAYAASRRGSAE